MVVDAVNIVFLLLISAVTIYVFSAITGLVKGGPQRSRDGHTERLYDSTYFLLRMFFGVMSAGSLVLLWLLMRTHVLRDGADLLARACGLLVISMWLPTIMRGDMMNRASKYLAEHGIWLTRFFHLMYTLRYEYWGSGRNKFTAVSGAVLGFVILIMGIHFFDAVDHAKAGLTHVLTLAPK